MFHHGLTPYTCHAVNFSQPPAAGFTPTARLRGCTMPEYPVSSTRPGCALAIGWSPAVRRRFVNDSATLVPFTASEELTRPFNVLLAIEAVTHLPAFLTVS